MARVFGEYDFPDRRLTLAGYRAVFLDVVLEHTSEVLTALYQDMLPPYREAAERVRAAALSEAWLTARLLRDGSAVLRQWEERRVVLGPEPFTDRRIEAFRALVEVHAGLAAWASRFQLREPPHDPWVSGTALGTLGWWHGHGDYVPRLEWWKPSVAIAYPLSEDERAFGGLPLSPGAADTLSEALEISEDARRGGAPDLLFEPRGKAEKRLVQLGFSRVEARAELDRVGKSLVERGMVRTRDKRSRGGLDATLHFEWLALFLCRNLRQAEIGRDGHGHTQQTISEAIRRTAALLGLQLPPENQDRSRRFKRRTS